jgi:hypothetical protein
MNAERHARIKQIFLAAIAMAETERDAYLDQQCGTDTVLRGEVASLLQHHDPRTIVADTPLAEASEPTPSRASPTGPWGRHVGVGPPPATIPRLRRLLCVALCVALLLALLGFGLHWRIRTSLQDTTAGKLIALRDAQALAVWHWMNTEKSKVESWARDLSLISEVEQLLEIDADSPGARERLAQAPQQAAIRASLQATVGGEPTYTICDRSGVVIANDLANGKGLGERLTSAGGAVLMQVLGGATVIHKPHEKKALLKSPRITSVNPLVVVITAIRNDQETNIAVIGISDPQATDGFSEILSIAPAKTSLETYAFDEQGMMLSESRFNRELKVIGLLANRPDARSSLHIEIRNPGFVLQPSTALRSSDEWPLTKMARLAIPNTANPASREDSDLKGYRDYRGVQVVGAWRWLPEEELGIAVEFDYDEAYAPLWYIHAAFGTLFGLLALAVGTALLSMHRVGHLKEQVGVARRLGQYTLEDKIGEGGIGVVYRARHVLLKRPTAIKLLKPEQVNDETLARFEREVQLASQLTHPNTIEIYDFGRTPEGVFYYAMEFLPGLTLAQLITLEGAIPAARVGHLLIQVCRSLREAHQLGMVHRDIKPANIMLCERGGDADVVKVLDFGLVKNVETPVDSNITAAGILSGTPQYIAPERLTDPGCLDTRSDIYSIGAVGYKLLTGVNVFSKRFAIDVFRAVLEETPNPPSQRTDNPIPPAFDQLILDCLAKDPADRPQRVDEILDVLIPLQQSAPWPQAAAHAWWDANADRI